MRPLYYQGKEIRDEGDYFAMKDCLCEEKQSVVDFIYHCEEWALKCIGDFGDHEYLYDREVKEIQALCRNIFIWGFYGSDYIVKPYLTFDCHGREIKPHDGEKFYMTCYEKGEKKYVEDDVSKPFYRSSGHFIYKINNKFYRIPFLMKQYVGKDDYTPFSFSPNFDEITRVYPVSKTIITWQEKPEDEEKKDSTPVYEISW